MANVAKVELKWNESNISLMNKKAVNGLFKLGFDIAAQARINAPYLSGALRSTIRVSEVSSDTIEVIAGGSFGGRDVPYAWVREQSNKLHPSRAHYMENAQKAIMVGNYMQKYFGDITK